MNLPLLRLCTLVLVFSLASYGSEETVRKQPKEKKPIAGLEVLTVGAYNLLNLFEKKGKIYDKAHQIFDLLPTGRRPLEETLKSLSDLKAQAEIIKNNQYDILTVSEVENLAALSAFSDEFLDGEYDSYLVEGNDPRGIDVGFLVKSSLPVEVEQRSHRNEVWNDPTQEGKQSRLFSRDFPALLFKTSKNAKPFMIYFGTHFKSKRDRPKDPESRILRAAQAERASQIVKAYEKEFGSQARVFVAGDFNGEVNHEKEFAPLLRGATLEDSFDVVSPPLSKEERITHSYFPKDGNPNWAQLDAVLVNSEAARFVQHAKVPHYHDKNGNELPVPKSYEELKKHQPSDHYPVHVELNFKSLTQ